MIIDEIAFEKLLLWLDPNRNKAGIIYKDIHTRLEKFFECRRCYHAEVCADETLDRVGKKLNNGEQIEADDKYRYCLGVARNVQKECWKIKPPVRIDEKLEPVPIDDPGQEESYKQKIKCQRECFENLSHDDQVLIILYLEGKKREREKLAKLYRITLETLRLRVFRIRQELRECQKKCLEKYKKD